MKPVSVTTILQDEEECLPYFFTFIEKSIGFDIISEVVFVDGGSKDRSVELIRNWENGCPVKLIQHEFESFGKQKNIGVNECTGKWILSVDIDMTCTTNFREELLKGKFDTRVMWDFQLFFTIKDKYHYAPGSGPTTRLFRNHEGIRYIWDMHEHPALPFRELGLDYSKEEDRSKAFDLMHRPCTYGHNSKVKFFEHSLRLSDRALWDRSKRVFRRRDLSASRGLVTPNRKNMYLTRRDGIINNKQVKPFTEEIKKLIP